MSARVTTDFWVSALVRRAFSEGGFAAILRKGSAEAGAVFILARGRLGEVQLFAPAAQASYSEAKPDDRMFRLLDGIADDTAADAKLEREKNYDPDLWIVELDLGSRPISEFLSVTTPSDE